MWPENNTLVYIHYNTLVHYITLVHYNTLVGYVDLHFLYTPVTFDAAVTNENRHLTSCACTEKKTDLEAMIYAFYPGNYFDNRQCHEIFCVAGIEHMTRHSCNRSAVETCLNVQTVYFQLYQTVFGVFACYLVYFPSESYHHDLHVADAVRLSCHEREEPPLA